MNLLDGKYVSEKLKKEIAADAAFYLAKSVLKPHCYDVIMANRDGDVIHK